MRLRVPSMLDCGSPRRTKMATTFLLGTREHFDKGLSQLAIERDASTMEWGVCCRIFQSRGLWSQSKRLLHVNCLELLACGFALKSFLRNKCNIHVKLTMDITTAISYINRMGGPASLVLSGLAFDLWQWCLERSIRVEAYHLPGRLWPISNPELIQISATGHWICPSFRGSTTNVARSQ